MAEVYTQRGGKYYSNAGGPGLYPAEFRAMQAKNKNVILAATEPSWWDRLNQMANAPRPEVQAAYNQAAAVRMAQNSTQGLASKVAQPVLTDADVTPLSDGSKIINGVRVGGTVAAKTKTRNRGNVARPVVYEAAKGKSPEEIKAIQRQLGVDVDGKWGPKTQAAYENSRKTGEETSAVVIEAPVRSSDVDQIPYPVWSSDVDQIPYEEEGLAAKVVRVPSKQELMVAKILGGDTRTAARMFE